MTSLAIFGFGIRVVGGRVCSRGCRLVERSSLSGGVYDVVRRGKRRGRAFTLSQLLHEILGGYTGSLWWYVGAVAAGACAHGADRRPPLATNAVLRPGGAIEPDSFACRAHSLAHRALRDPASLRRTARALTRTRPDPACASDCAPGRRHRLVPAALGPSHAASCVADGACQPRWFLPLAHRRIGRRSAPLARGDDPHCRRECAGGLLRD